MKRWILSAAFCLLLAGCSAGNPSAGDPVERGCSYIAGAIITAAVIRAIFG